MLIGRAVFGVGAESLYVTQTTILASWFDEGSIATALSLLLVSSRLSSVMNSLIGPVTASPVEASSIGLYLCIASWGTAALLSWKHKQYGNVGLCGCVCASSPRACKCVCVRVYMFGCVCVCECECECV